MKTKHTVLMSTILVFLFIAPSFGKSYKFDYQKNIDLPRRAELVISNSYGNISITGAQVKMITINAVKNVRAIDEDEAENIGEHIEIKAQKQGRRVNLKVRYLRMAGRASSFWEKLLGTGSDSFGSVDFDIIVPNECDVDIDNTSGEIRVSGITGMTRINGTSDLIKLSDIIGDIEINSMTGDIKTTNIRGNIDISSGGSNILFNGITGSIDIRSTSGNKTGEHLVGAVSISQTSGKVILKNLDGDLRLKSTSGKVEVEQNSGAVDITTYTGNVNVRTELYSGKDSYIETSSGNVVFSIPEMSSGSVKLETVSGDIDSEVSMSIKSLSKSKLSGKFGGDGPRISIVTSSGDITIRQY
jgi:hypothetical protein